MPRSSFRPRKGKEDEKEEEEEEEEVEGCLDRFVHSGRGDRGEDW